MVKTEQFFVVVVTLGLGYGTCDLHCGMPDLFILFFLIVACTIFNWIYHSYH